MLQSKTQTNRKTNWLGICVGLTFTLASLNTLQSYVDRSAIEDNRYNLMQISGNAQEVDTGLYELEQEVIATHPELTERLLQARIERILREPNTQIVNQQ